MTSVDGVEIGLPLRIGNTSGLPSPSVRAASRTSSALPHSGIRRFVLIRRADRVHRWSAVSISSQWAPRHLARPRGRQHQELEGELDGRLRGPGPYRSDGGGHVPCGPRQPVRYDVVLRAEHRQHAVAAAGCRSACPAARSRTVPRQRHGVGRDQEEPLRSIE